MSEISEEEVTLLCPETMSRDIMEILADESPDDARTDAANNGGTFPLLSDAESVCRFPGSRVAVEILPDHSGMVLLRVLWQRGKATIPLFETTPLRAVAQVTQGGDTFPLSLSRYARRKRSRVLLAGRRKTGREIGSFLRYGVQVDGKDDKLVWQWHVAGSPDLAKPNGQIELRLPFAPGRARTLRATSAYESLAVWINEVVVTMAVPLPIPPTDAATPLDFSAPNAPRLTLRTDDNGVIVTCADVTLAPHGLHGALETWHTGARTEVVAITALHGHLADLARRAQILEPIPLFFCETHARATAHLMGEGVADKRGMDRLVLRGQTPKTHVNGRGADASLVAGALLLSFYQTGDDAIRRRARLIGRGVCDYSMSIEGSPHFGAVYEAWREKKRYADSENGDTLGVVTTARTARGLLVLHDHFETEILQRTAMTAAQWLMLKLDREGFLPAERFTQDNRPILDAQTETEGESSTEAQQQWAVAETIIPMAEAYRRTENEVFLKTALRMAGALQDGIQSGDARFAWEWAGTERLAATIEALLLVSREHERKDLIETALRVGLTLRGRICEDGSFLEPDSIGVPLSPVAASLVGARAALALARVDADPMWPLIAARALHFAHVVSLVTPDALTVGDWGALCRLPIDWLLTIGARAKECVADRDLCTIRRNHQVFQPDPSTREYIQVTREDDATMPLDHLALVYPHSRQALVIIAAPADVSRAAVVKNNRRPFLKNLLTGDFDPFVTLSPLGDSGEINIAVVTVDS